MAKTVLTNSRDIIRLKDIPMGTARSIYRQAGWAFDDN